MSTRTHEEWRKSSYSGSDGDNCVEVTAPPVPRVRVRDSKNVKRLPLQVSRHAWAAFTTHLRAACTADDPGSG
ncbi:DUF397 domain-containing protein [Streptomyces xiaopingdaonensis]|uniref:DUF397 domain-containing protein n=1 Tax=Streptomyces xiaopingdaonensis TaxID=1565415 RepID=UPI000998BD69|nr:DUF397 domain-containing protein [Streptomyces xiaopingdaonensis]